MSVITTVRSERIDIRTSAEAKAVIERAAALSHSTLSAYLLDAALQKAEEDLSNSETILLREADRVLFFSALDNPPEPNEALRKLFANGRNQKS